MGAQRTYPAARRPLAFLGAAVLAAAGAIAAPAAAFADYGNSSVYQIELSANLNGQSAKLLGGTGGGAWLWIELSSDHTGDYQGADCGHGGPTGAARDSGEVTWSDSNGWITIDGVILNGLGGFPTTITVPDTFGHYSGKVGTYLTLPFPPSITANLGTAQLQVAP
ncbi:MAG TPA: hypothetical protein VJR25_15645 [Microbacterium sp.]|uniref:hypothetical protein n=1 Tax=Microbacterium sp. TaxID=51671 RepID=UPI002B48778D|nr:hypothetical protein [Microbacterium sp.]HKT58195.1 hypothetical protein [Microbacterium sp.]